MAKMKRPTFEAEVFESLDALCTNKDRSKVAVAGRTVTKVFAIYDDHFELLSDRNKPRKTMYFSGSIAWSPIKENLIAAASSNGAIYAWDPESPQTLEYSYKAHKQLATKVCFSEFNENILVSGSKDSTIWLYDLRAAEPSTCFASNQDDSIRDIQFCMESKLQDTFVSAGDSGTIRFWDARRPDKAMKEFIAHSSQVYSIALNPQIQSKNLIATAGRDKYIRIWDWSKNTPQFLYTVEMMAIVTRVSWCPDNSWHVACCFAPPSGFVSSDNTIYVWDIRRPFIPFASFDAHTKTCTDMSWPRYTGNTFLSCGKDGRLISNFTESAKRPILYANAVALGANTSFCDELVVAVPSYRRKSSSSTLVDTCDPFRRRVPSILFTAAPADPFLMDCKAIAYFGKNYKITGGLMSELCEHNAIVAENILKDRLAYTWRMIGTMIVSAQIDSVRPQFIPNCAISYTQNAEDNLLAAGRDIHTSGNSLGDGKRKEGNEVGGGFAANGSSAAMLISGSLTAYNPFSTNMELFFGADELNLGGMGKESEKAIRASRRSIVSSSIINLTQLSEEAFDLNRRMPRRSITTTAAGHRNKKKLRLSTKQDSREFNDTGLVGGLEEANEQFSIEEEEEEQDLIEDEQQKMRRVEIRSAAASSSSSTDDGLQEEFEEEKIEGEGRTPKTWHDGNAPNRFGDTGFINGCSDANLSPHHGQGQSSSPSLQFDPLPSLRSLLNFYSNLGDVQMCATICLVMGEQLLNYKLVSADQMELWFHMYLELLDRLKLWTVASLLIKTCCRNKINQLSNESTFVKVLCQNCRNVATRAGLSCSKCRQLYNYTCALCETPVRGIWSSCSECGHGGHLPHMEEWFSQFPICPATGCGHICSKNRRNAKV